MAKYINELPQLGDGGVPPGPLTTSDLMILEHANVTIQITVAQLATLVAAGVAAFAETYAVTGTTHNIDNANSGKYHRFTNSAAKSCTFRPQTDHAISADAEFHIRNANTSNLTLTAGSGVTLNAPAGGTLVLAPRMTVTVKKVATDVYDVLGHTVAA